MNSYLKQKIVTLLSAKFWIFMMILLKNFQKRQPITVNIMVVCTGIIFSNVQNSYKVTSSHVWYNSKIMVGKKSLFMKY